MSTAIMPKSVPMPMPTLEEKMLHLVPHPTLRFEVHIVDHCDLNCQMCAHFSPLSAPQFTDLGSFSQDLQRLRELFGDEVAYIMLLGGEPLLHPNLPDFLYAARAAFPCSDLILYTNGLKLPRMSHEFWASCEMNQISVTLTRYPIPIDYTQIELLLEQHQMEYRYCNTPGREKCSSHFPLDLNGTQDPRLNFLNCNMANRCIFLRDGKLYTCPVIPNIQHFNSYFHTDLKVSSLDAIDIYQATDAREIMRFLASPPPFCRYCDVSKRTILHKWAPSKGSILEWT